MSLDVYLKLDNTTVTKGSGIFIRENGATREISREEWDEKFPGTEPIVVSDDNDSDEVFWRNITHNLNKMAGEAGIYQHLWRPEELGITKAGELIEPLTKGLELLRSDPDRFKAFNPSNGWGSYEALLEFVSSYLEACTEHPSAVIRVSR
jgi:hypothetical protein